MRGQSFETFPHDADMGVRGAGATLESAFEAAACAVFSIITDFDAIQPSKLFEFFFEESDKELALVKLLNELICEAQTSHCVFGRFSVTCEGDRWHCKAWGEPWREDLPQGTEVKGATLTQLWVKQVADHWVAQCIVDV